jgi:NADPH:quinone reductase
LAASRRAFPGIARQLGAARVVGTVRSSKLDAAAVTRLPYDRIVDSSELPIPSGARSSM